MKRVILVYKTKNANNDEFRKRFAKNLVTIVEEYTKRNVCVKGIVDIEFTLRVGWEADKILIEYIESRRYTIESFLKGLFWIPTYGMKPLLGLTFGSLRDCVLFLDELHKQDKTAFFRKNPLEMLESKL